MINAIDARRITEGTTEGTAEDLLGQITDLIKTAATQKKFEVKVIVPNKQLVTCQKVLIENGFDIRCDDIYPEFTHSYIIIRW
jgi:hypothetical protein